MKHLIMAAVTLLSFSAPVIAQDNPVIVELYTSQGCSSCPPADVIAKKLAEAGDQVLPLAFHVDYWDYIGWKDTFADAQYSDRQRSYARQLGQKSVYTPQFIIGGTETKIGAGERDIYDVIARLAAERSVINFSVSTDKRVVTVKAAPLAARTGPLVVQVLQYQPEAVVDIKRGENAGRKLTYTNIVRSVEVAGEWDGRSELNLTHRIADPALKTVVLLQQEGPGRIVASRVLR